MLDDVVISPALVVVGEHVDFDDFYRCQYDSVLRVAAAVTGDLHRAADVTQDAFVATQRRWRTVARYDRPDLWVRRVAINGALSWRRRLRNEVVMLSRLALGRERPPAGTGLGDSEVWRHVARLPRQQAAMIALVYVEDMSVEQAAHTLSIAVPTAKTHLQRARKTLANKLTEEIDNDR